MDQGIAGLLRQRAQEQPDFPFIKCATDRYLTYAELDEAVDNVAGGLRALGVAPGDRIAVIAPNRMEVVEVIFACARLGAIEVPLNYWLKGDFLRYQLDHCGASLLIADDLGLAAAAPFLSSTDIREIVALDEVSIEGVRVTGYEDVRRGPKVGHVDDIGTRDVFSIVYTSGTTGYPKGCVLGHGYYFAAARAYQEGGWILPGDRVFTAFPLFHGSGQIASLVPALANRASICMEPEFRASTFIQRAVEEEASMLFGIGAMGMAVLASPPGPADGQGKFRLAAWMPMTEENQRAFERRFAVPVTAEGYGLSECQPVTMSDIAGRRERSSMGRAVSHFEVEIVDDGDLPVAVGEVGEIVVRGREPDVMFQRYWKDPESTVAAFRGLWYHTGDLARSSETGFIYFVDRKKHVIRRRGENVSSVELEAALLRHPGIAQVAAVGIQSPLGEEDIKVCIVPRAGDLEMADLFEFCKANLPYFAIPRYVEFLTNFPVNAMGRVMKNRLRDDGVTGTTTDLEAEGFRVARAQRRVTKR